MPPRNILTAVACLAAILCVTAAAPLVNAAEPAPTDDVFTGSSGGCANCLVYRFNPAMTTAVEVRIVESRIPKQDERATLTIGQGVASVRVLQFRDAAKEYFCDDVAGDPPPLAVWKAVEGTVEFERGPGPPPPEFRNATHWVSMKLKDVTLKNDATGATATLKEVPISKVWVGWFAG
jgi:hypothetical protein